LHGIRVLSAFPGLGNGGLSAFPGLDNDRAGTRELVAELRHRSLDSVKCSRGHHAQDHALIRPASEEADPASRGVDATTALM
jgi:hypothetical protein